MNVTPAPGTLSKRSSSLQNKEDRIAQLKKIYAPSSNTESREPIDTTAASKRTTRSGIRSNKSSGVNSNYYYSNYMSPNPSRMDGESFSSENEVAREITPVKQCDDDAESNLSPSSNDDGYYNNQDQPSPNPDWPLTGILEPGPNDCLFGRGGGTNHHPGNKKYRKMVEEKKDKYLHSKRLDKPLVAMEIINEWRSMDPPGRFLKQDERTKLWSDVGDRKAREKTSQALREKTPGDSERETRFEPGTLSPRGRPSLARDHSLGTEPMGGAYEMSLEGFSWDEEDRPVVESRGAHLNNYRHHHPVAAAAAPYSTYHVRDHSLANNPLPDTSTSHPAPSFGDPYYYHHYHPHYPPPPPHHYPHPPPPSPPHYQSPQGRPQFQSSEKQRQHSLQMNPLKGASITQPARDTFTDPNYERQAPPPVPPPHPSYYYPPMPQHHWGPPPPPPHYYPGAQSSAFTQYDGSVSMRSANSSEYDDGEEATGTAQDFTKIATLIRDTTEGTLSRSFSADESSRGSSEQIHKSHSMPVQSEGSFPSPPDNASSKKHMSGIDPASKDVRKPSLLKKISGGQLQNMMPARLPDCAIRPEPVKRETSNQPETLETKRSPKRVILSRDKSAISRSLKEAQMQKELDGTKLSSKLSKADLDRKLSVEINRLVLNDAPIPLTRMTTSDVLESLINDENLASSLSQPASLAQNNRLSTIDVVAQDIYNGGNRLQSVEWDDTLDLLAQASTDAEDDPGEIAVDEDIAARWISGESAHAGTEI